MEVSFKNDNVTVIGNMIVFGEGSDWIVRDARTTNPGDDWQEWFGKRNEAEEYAASFPIDRARKPL